LIRAGRVHLNGAVRRDPETPVRLERDRIEVDGRAVQVGEKIYIVLNKPRGAVTTASDEKGRETVYTLLEPGLPWVAPVGRLDKASEGLLLLTNDSEWAAHIADPETHLEKTYHVQVSGTVEEAVRNRMVEGIRDGGDLLRARSVDVLRGGKQNTWLEVVLDEGKNREIRRMCERSGLQVLRLVRVAIGPLELGELAKGKSRRLEAEEKSALDAAMASRRRAGC
jgi:23S rRNA pseudouridine2605 synthase